MAKKKIKPGDGTMASAHEAVSDAALEDEVIPEERSDPKDVVVIPKPLFLKNPETLRVFPATPELLKRKDLITCNKEGTTIEDTRVF